MSNVGSTRHVSSLNEGWLFQLGETFPDGTWSHGNISIIANETHLWQKADNHGLSKPGNPHIANWRRVDVPHDFVLEGPYTTEAPVENGSLKGGVAWYIKSFDLSAEDASRRIQIEFDGVYRDCMIFCNGHFIDRHLSGYTSFSVHVSEVAQFGGQNVVAVRVDATQNELWSYEGGGIYRAVRLVKTHPIHIPVSGVYVRTGGRGDESTATIDVSVRNDSFDDVSVKATCRIVDPDGVNKGSVDSALAVPAKQTVTITLRAVLDTVRLWDVDSPILYRLSTELSVDATVIDQVEQQFGFRYFEFDPNHGFSLNGKKMKLKGLCCHQDHAGVGVAVPPSLQEWRIRHLKELGANAMRTSHNPPDPALLDACDRLGMLVMDECRLPGATGERLAEFEALIRRDRSHPSVIMWSMGNEEMGIQGNSVAVRLLQRMHHLAKTLDPTRPTTYAMNWLWLEWCKIHDKAPLRYDVFGANYRTDNTSKSYDQFHEQHPDWPLLGSETGGAGYTRGLYEPDVSDLPVVVQQRWLDSPACWLGDSHKHYASAYGNWRAGWGYSVEETWQDCVARPYMAGTFLWTGFDYRGETAPYDWPAVITRFGILDYCGFYKEIAHYLRAWWRPEVPHLFLMPHWNWEGREDESIAVWCYGNTATVELFLNGRSLGIKNMPTNGRLEWAVPFEAGELTAIGRDHQGSEILRTWRRTAGQPHAIALSVEHMPAQQQTGTVLVVNAAIQDATGALCPRADNKLTFDVDGPARILGVGNGNPLSHEPDHATNQRKAFHGLCQIILQRTANSGLISILVRGDGVHTVSIGIEAQS